MRAAQWRAPAIDHGTLPRTPFAAAVRRRRARLRCAGRAHARALGVPASAQGGLASAALLRRLRLPRPCALWPCNDKLGTPGSSREHLHSVEAHLARAGGDDGVPVLLQPAEAVGPPAWQRGAGERCKVLRSFVCPRTAVVAAARVDIAAATVGAAARGKRGGGRRRLHCLRGRDCRPLGGS